MKKFKKVISLVLCFLLVIGVLAACGKKADTTESASSNSPTTEPAATQSADTQPTDTPPAENVKLTLGIWPEDTLTADIEMHKGYVKTFGENHPNVEVVPAYYKYAVDTFVPMAESGNLPVIFETWFTEPQKLIAGGYVADITDELQARGWDSKINPAIKDLLSKDGRIYGLPRDGYALGLMCNIEMFKTAGLVDGSGNPIYPKTWDEFAQTAKKIKDATGQAGFCLLAADNAGGWHFSNIAWAFGATLTTMDANGKFTANINTPEAIAAMEFVKSLKWNYDVLTANPTSENWGTGFAELGTGAAAMYIAANDAVNQPTQVNGLPADKLFMCPIPAGPGGQYSLSGGTPYMFSKDATPDQINAALDYLEVMGKAPVVTDASLEGMKADAQNRVDNGVPVIMPFPCWTAQDVLDAQASVVKEFQNVDPSHFDSYFSFIKKPGALRSEEPGSAQDLYAELTKVLQAVVADKNADVATLMKTANDNYQALLDTKVNNLQ